MPPSRNFSNFRSLCNNLFFASRSLFFFSNLVISSSEENIFCCFKLGNTSDVNHLTNFLDFIFLDLINNEYNPLSLHLFH
uniref:Uncharacterized protein n=1 Tax=viral metagenome TaxID=1070528 RepID=A0A6C0EE80_9ZZZZ